jgi:predicted nucleic acid-binding Zn ribbon protein
MAKQNQTTTQGSTRKTLTIVVLVLVALGFYITSFFVARG